MARLSRTQQEKELQIKIKALKVQEFNISKVIKDITNHLSGEGISRRIRPCDVNDPNEKDCPWPIK